MTDHSNHNIKASEKYTPTTYEAFFYHSLDTLIASNVYLSFSSLDKPELLEHIILGEMSFYFSMLCIVFGQNAKTFTYKEINFDIFQGFWEPYQ